MNKEMLERINLIFRELFDDDSLEITDKTTSDDIDGWDSFMHINLISMIEAEFGVNFDITQIESFKSVGDIACAISEKLGPDLGDVMS